MASADAPRPTPRFAALDGLRAVGALAVMLTHVGFQSGAALTGPFAGILARFDCGVALFFVVSGFLLFRPYPVARLSDRPPPAVGPYLWHRALRILPVLWVTVLACAVLAPTAGAGWAAYAEHAALIQIYTGNPLLHALTQLWSLATEVAFYLVLPLFGRLLLRGRDARSWARRTIAVGAAGAALSCVWMAAVTAAGQPDARLWLPGYAGWFGGGIALAAWQVARDRGVLAPGRVDALLERPGTVWAIAAALFVLVSTPLVGPLDLTEPTPAQAALKNLAYGVIGLLVVAPTVLAPRPTNAAFLGALSGRIGSFLGRISYGIFAYHVLMLYLAERLLGRETFDGGFFPRLGVTLVLTIAAASVSYYGMELPVMRRGRGWAPRRAGSHARATAGAP